jgi:hypothetical protein
MCRAERSRALRWTLPPALLIMASASGQNNLPAPMYVTPGAPYSGEQVQERVETPSDGSRAARTVEIVKLYRDSEGRTRTERPLVTEIDDPVAGVRYTLDSRNKIAHRVNIPKQQIVFGDQPGAILLIPAGDGVRFTPPVGGAPVGVVLTMTVGNGTKAPQPQLTTEDLGTLTMEGLLVEGTRQTLTISTEGKPTVTVTDTWTSPDLHLALLSKVTGATSGETTVKMTHLSRSEPPAELFRPPPDYQILDGN